MSIKEAPARKRAGARTGVSADVETQQVGFGVNQHDWHAVPFVSHGGATCVDRRHDAVHGFGSHGDLAVITAEAVRRPRPGITRCRRARG